MDQETDEQNDKKVNMCDKVENMIDKCWNMCDKTEIMTLRMINVLSGPIYCKT